MPAVPVVFDVFHRKGLTSDDASVCTSVDEVRGPPLHFDPQENVQASGTRELCTTLRGEVSSGLT